MTARYKSLGSFAKEYPGNAVEKTLISKHLVAIEQYCESIFPAP